MIEAFKHHGVFLFALLWLIVAAHADITVKSVPPGPERTVPTVTRNGVLLVALPLFLEQFGYKWQWDAAVRQLTCSRNAEQLVFTQDLPLYIGPAGLAELSDPPCRIGATLFMPMGAALDLAKNACRSKVRFNQASQILTINKTGFSIISAGCEKKQRGMLVTIELADSLLFDHSYDHPYLTLSFFGATADTALLKASRRIGFVDSLRAVQLDGSAQVTIVLAREIDEPQIDYIQDIRTVLVSLQPKKTAAETRAETASVSPRKGIGTIVIDPGHGGRDPGAIGPGGVKEKDITLAVALYLRDLLKKKNEVSIFLTRDRDEFVALADRTNMANKRNADLFISIHANAISGSQKKREVTRGYKIYFLSQAKNEEDKLAAMRENAVIELEEKPQNYTALQNVLIDLAGNEYLRESQDLSILVVQQFESALRKKILRMHHGIGQANFWVLNGAYMPSILVECGFISNKAEEKILSDKQFQKEMATAIFEAVVNFKKKYETGL